MYKGIDVASLIAVFDLSAEQMARREKVGTYIHSFSALVYDRMYNHYLLKDPLYHSILSSADVPRLIRMQSEYLSSLFIHPFDERLLLRTRQIGDIHIAIGLESVHISRGFEILNGIIISLSDVNAQIREDLGIILKMLRISETVMNESYFRRYAADQEELKKENELLSLFDRLYASLMVHKQSQKKVERWYRERTTLGEAFALESDESLCPLTRRLDELTEKKEVLASLGIELEDLKTLHQAYHAKLDLLSRCGEGECASLYEEISTISTELNAILDQPLKDISTTSFLGVHSGIEFLQACTRTMHEKAGFVGESGEKVHDYLRTLLMEAMGWCLDELYVGDGDPEPEGQFDVNDKIFLRQRRISIAIRIKEISNKTYMAEVIKILLEVVRHHFSSREREAALLQLVDQVERASQSKDMFLANMSHELRTPLNAIIGFSQILGMNPTLPVNLKPYIEKIGIAGNNLLTLVNTILDFAKLEAGKLTFKPDVTLISGMMHDVAAIIEPMALKKSITFGCPELISLTLYLDRQLIHQVLLNLLSNAIKFTPEGGSVTLSLDFDDALREYRFGVCDTGIGIEAKEIATLFDPFTQVENPFQKSAKGTGLGLAISKRIVEDLHGGRLWVESEIGKGSCFYFTIPVSQVQNILERHTSPNPDARRLLIVEDAPEYQKMLTDRLGETYHLVVTNSINRAKEVLENETFDFIVLDFFLVDGISSEVLQFMEQNSLLIPVIIISAEDDSKLIAHLPQTENVEGIFNKTHIHEICDYLTNHIPRNP